MWGESRGTAAASSTFGWEVITIDFMHLPVLRELVQASLLSFLQECDVAHPGE